VNAHLARAWPRLAIPPERGGPAPKLVDLVDRMTARRREDRPASWEEIVATLWQALDEVRPAVREIAERKAEAGPSGDLPSAGPGRAPDGGDVPFPARPAAGAVLEPALEPAARLLSRELVLGRVVLVFGVAALLGALAFAVHVVVSAPSPPASAGTPAAAPLPPGGAPGRLLVALVPGGVLEAVVDASGRTVAGPAPLPADLALPAGPYRARLVHAESGCAMTVSFEVRPGGTTRVLESCLPAE